MASWQITTTNTPLAFDGTNVLAGDSACMIDSNHAILFWSWQNAYVRTQTHAINTSTWAVTTTSAILEIDTSDSGNQYSALLQIDSAHYVGIWGTDSHQRAQTFAVNTTTYAVSTAATYFEFSATQGTNNSAIMIDSNHFLASWNTYVQVFTVNTSTWAITTAAAALDFGAYAYYGSFQQLDANHFVLFKTPSSGSEANVLTVNTSNWTVTTASSALTYDAAGNWHRSAMIDSAHAIDFYAGGSSDGFAQVFAINTSTWAITTASSSLEFDTANGTYNASLLIKDNYFINAWAGNGSDGFVQTFTVNTSTWAVTTAYASLEFNTNNATWNFITKIDDSHYLIYYENGGAKAEVLAVEVPVTGPANLKTYNTNAKANIKTINTNPIANVKTLNTNA